MAGNGIENVEMDRIIVIIIYRSSFLLVVRNKKKKTACWARYRELGLLSKSDFWDFSGTLPLGIEPATSLLFAIVVARESL